MNSRRNDCNAAMFWHCQSFGRGVFELRKIENGKIDPGGVISRVKFARWPQLLLEVLSQSYLAACLMAKAARSLACAPPPVLRAARVCPTGKVARCSRVVFSCASSSRPPLACCCGLGSLPAAPAVHCMHLFPDVAVIPSTSGALHASTFVFSPLVSPHAMCVCLCLRIHACPSFSFSEFGSCGKRRHSC